MGSAGSGGCCADDRDEYPSASKGVSQRRVYNHDIGFPYGYGESKNFLGHENEDQANYFEWRPVGKDEIIKKAHLWILFDGQNGWQCSTYCAELAQNLFTSYLRNVSSMQNVISVIEVIFERFDKKILEKSCTGGCSCVAVLIVGGEFCWVIHLGACRAVIFQNGEVIHETPSHVRPEKQIQRVLGETSKIPEPFKLSSCLGHWALKGKNGTELKEHFTNRPTITRLNLQEYRKEKPLYILLSTGGLFDVITAKRIPDMISSGSLSQSCAEIIRVATAEKAREDISLFLLDANSYRGDNVYSRFHSVT